MSLAAALRKAFDQGVGTLAAGRHIYQLSGGPTSTGQPVGAERALRYASFFAAVRVLSESIAQLPLILYRRLPGGGKERATDHPLYSILHDRPNPYMTSFAWREAAMAHLCTWGNAYAAIGRDGLGRVAELWPMAPDRMTVTRDSETGAPQYRYRPAGAGAEVTLSHRDVFHVAGLMWDGVQGYSFLTVAREAVAVGLAIEQYTGRFFANDARPGVVYTHPKTLSDAARENLRKSLQAAHEGVGNAWRFALLEEGMTVTTIPAEDARFLEAAKFQRNQIASLFRIPPHMLGDLERATHSNVEQQSLEFVIYTLAPWLVRWEQAIGLQLLGDEWVGAGGDLFVEFLVDGLLRGDTSTRYAAYHMARLDGWLSADEIRERENLNPLPDGAGETYWTPLNVTTSGPDGTTISATLAQPARSSPAGGEG